MTLTVPTNVPVDAISHIVGAIVIAVVAFVLGRRLRSTTVRLVEQRSRLDAAGALLAGRLVYLTILVFAGFWILNLWGSGITPLVTVLGVAGIAVSLALQDVLRNLFAGFYLLIERPFTIGDFIEVAGTSGAVENIDLRLTVLRTLDGFRVTVPNATVFTSVITNQSSPAGRSWLLVVTLPPAAASLDGLQRAVERVAAHTMPEGLPPAVVLQSLSEKGAVAHVRLNVPDITAVSAAMLALRAELPLARVSLPEAPAIPDNLPVPAAPPVRRRITRDPVGRVATPASRAVAGTTSSDSEDVGGAG
jgi:small-conductance mechanosensitive channel